MRNQITENKDFYILSRNIDNATKCSVIDACEDCFHVKLYEKLKYEKDESVELFAMTDKGQLYFETVIKDISEDVLSIWFPISYKYLQRREYSRITSDIEIILDKSDSKLNAKIVDISAGGLKVITNEQLELKTGYNITINIENRCIKCVFEPIRIESFKNTFISSGLFKKISNSDRITLVQYCFRKLIENNNI